MEQSEKVMQDLGFALLNVGYAGIVVGWFWTVRLAYRRSPVLGCASLLAPAIILYLLITSPRTTWRQGLLILAGLAAVIGGYRIYNA